MIARAVVLQHEVAVRGTRVGSVLAEVAGERAWSMTRCRLDELARRVLEARDDRRQVTADVHARYFGAALDDRSLTPGNDARIASTRFEDWLSQSAR